MKKRRLKPFVKVSLLLVLLVVSLITIGVVSNSKTSLVSKQNDDFVYVNDYIFDNYYPVINEEEKLQRPYSSDKVSVYKTFYEKNATEEEQQKSIIYHEGIYMQNSGVDYKADETFDVLSALSGTVSNVSEDTLLGKTIEIRNSSEVVVIYQSLGEVSVKKGDTVNQGQVIGKSGNCALHSDLKNTLHFEIYKNGTVINPLKYYDKSLKEISSAE